MGSRWLQLVLAIPLIQGLLCLSPVPVPEEEWEEFARMLRDPSYRLPTTTKPRHYDVNLTPYFDSPPTNVEPFTFDGQVSIFLVPTISNVNEIVLHCNDLTIQDLKIYHNNEDIAVPNQDLNCIMPQSFLKLKTNKALELGKEYEARMSFRGNFQTNMRGFYRSWYTDNTNQKRWMGTTQFQPGHARQAFPCYDEPSFKATFDITINREDTFSPTISNMPIRSNVTLTNGRISETFFTTPKTSTYLLAFIVSHYEVAATNNDENRPFHIFARNNADITGQYALEIGEKLLKEMDDFTQIPYYSMAANMDMKQAAIPDFSAGAMENWGLLTYREALVLYDPMNTNNHYKQRIANIISHEITHMWFGNLVTCAWWDNLWLNEGFARLYQYFLTNAVAPEMGFDIRFIVEQLQTVMINDSVDNAHSLTNVNVNDPTSVSAHFSSITYARGAAIIRMTHHLLGFATYRKGLRYYLSNRRYDVAEPRHLFSAWDLAAAEDGSLSGYGGITIDRYFRSWSEKSGHPLLTVNVDHKTGRMLVTQARWERNTGVSQRPSLWDIPITWTRGGAPDFENLKPSMMITAQSTVVERGTAGLEWVIFNKQQASFFRVNYDDTTWSLLTRTLRSTNRTIIHEINRAQIVDDLFALARAGVMPYSRAFNILSFLEFEDAYAPWISAINGFNFALRRLAHDDANVQKLRNNIVRLSSAITGRLGFAEVTGETFMDGLLRMHVMNFLCGVGHPQCVSEARANYQKWRTGDFISANMRPWVYCSGLRTGDAADFNIFWDRYLTEDLANEKIVMLEAAGCTLDQSSFDKFLSAVTDGQETVRPQDFSTAFASATNSNEQNTLRALTWLGNNLERTINNTGSASTLISNIAARLLNENQITDFQNFLEQNSEKLGSAYNTGVNGIQTTRNNLAWSSRRIPEFETFFDTGYVDDVINDPIDPTTTTTTTTTTTAAPTTTTTQAPTTPENNSASSIVLSVISLVATVAVALAA